MNGSRAALLAALLTALLGACVPAGVAPTTPPTTALSPVLALAWGTVADYQVQYRRQDRSGPWAEVDWYRNGCAYHLTLGFSRDFTPACDLHDFGYRNLRRSDQTRTAAHRLTTDLVFLAHMRAICAGLEPQRQPACLTSAQWHYWTVRVFGGLFFTAVD